jgi:antirestriction protein ArdC
MMENAKLCPIHHAGFAAYYSLEDDIIRIPAPSTFHSQEDYYHTLYHEMTHASGHSSRLNRRVSRSGQDLVPSGIPRRSWLPNWARRSSRTR